VDLRADMFEGAWNGAWQAVHFPLDEWPDGRATGIRGTLGEGRGTVESRGGGLRVEGRLEVRAPSGWACRPRVGGSRA